MKVKRFKVRHEPGGCRVTCVITPVLRLITSSQTRSLSYQFPVSRVTFRSLRPVQTVPYSPWPWDPLNVNVNGDSHGGCLTFTADGAPASFPSNFSLLFSPLWKARTSGTLKLTEAGRRRRGQSPETRDQVAVWTAMFSDYSALFWFDRCE